MCYSSRTCLLQNDQDLRLGLGDFRRNEKAETARLHDPVPDTAGLVEREVLIIQFECYCAGRPGFVSQPHTGQGIADQLLDLIARSELDQIGHLLDQRSEEHTSELQSRQYLVCR